MQNSRAVPVHVMEQTFLDGVILLEFYFSLCVRISSYWPQANNYRTTGLAALFLSLPYIEHPLAFHQFLS